MVTVVRTSTDAAATRTFNGRHLDRNQDGTLWTIYQATAGSAATTRLDYSKDNGATWTSTVLFGDPASGVTNMSLHITDDDRAALVWRQAGAAQDRETNHIYVAWGTPNANRTDWTWSASRKLLPAQFFNVNYPDVWSCRSTNGTGWDVFVVASYNNEAGDRAAVYKRFPVSSDGAIGLGTYDNLPAGLTNQVGTLGITSGDSYPSIDGNHTGNGKTVASGTPHLYVGWTAGMAGAGKGVRFRKAVYSGGSWAWNAEREIDTLVGVNDPAAWITCHFDGTRAVLSGDMSRGGGTFDLIAHDRDAADTNTIIRRLLSNAVVTDYQFYGSATYDQAGNVYLFGRDGSGTSGTRKLNYRKWTRSTGTLGPIITVDPSGNDTPYVSAKRGYNPGNAIEVVYTDGAASPYTVQYDRTVVLNTAPGAPLLLSPPNASSRDLAAGFTFDWEPQDPDVGDTQLAYAFRRKVAGAASYEYWNAMLSAFQSTEVFNPGGASDLTFGPGKWTSGLTYNWSVRTRDAGSPALDGPFATDGTVTASRAPVVTVTAPGGTITNTSRPLVEWTFADLDGDPQESYRVRVLTQAVYSAAGFDPVNGPGTAPAVAESGPTPTLSADARSFQVPTDLDNMTTYRAYVQAGQAGDQRSAWSFSAFTLDLTPPNPPTLTATVEPALARVRLDLTSTDPGPDFTPANSAFMVEVSTDGTPWTTVRGAGEVPVAPDGSGVAYDYEAVLGMPTSYRARTVSST